MSDLLTLKATMRTQKGKNASRQLRAKGVIPAVFYAPNGENKVIQVQEAALYKLYSSTGRTTMFNLDLEENGKTTVHPSLVWDVEYHPTKARFYHVDFYGVDLEKEILIRIPIEFIGTSKGVKAGGKLEVYRDQLDILSKPATLPQKITVDITDLDINQGLRVEDLLMPEGVRAKYDENFAIALVHIPGGSAEDEAAEEGK